MNGLVIDFATIISTAIGVIVGGVITWYFSWLYYKKSGDQLRKELAELIVILEHIKKETGLIGL